MALEGFKERFDKKGIEISFPYRTIVFKDEKSRRRVTRKK